ncbi:MAG: hypothetical protein WCK77_00340, partial [Verrucomicrobiota bacterium]
MKETPTSTHQRRNLLRKSITAVCLLGGLLTGPRVCAAAADSAPGPRAAETVAALAATRTRLRGLLGTRAVVWLVDFRWRSFEEAQ